MTEYQLPDLDPAYADMELSTQLLIHAAQKRQIKVRICDRKAHFLCLSKGGRKQYLKEATKTALDSYMTFLLMEDKFMSKLLLEEAGLGTPRGLCFASKAKALQVEIETPKREQHKLMSGPLVVKPVTSNFGLGITSLETHASQEEYIEAVQTAFTYADRILVEEWIEGQEYRFFVLGGECAAVCKRIAANVIGDGKSSIGQLVEAANQDPRRGCAHATPLEKIQLGEVERKILQAQGLRPESIISKEQQIFLRMNSNVSTGGESIECTEEMPDCWKKLAVKAARCLKAQICGVDMILPSLKAETMSYAILELNYNPVLYIHECPAKGKAQPVSDKLLDFLGF